MKIGLLGFGVVGRGVYDLVADRDDIHVAKAGVPLDITIAKLPLINDPEETVYEGTIKI